MDEGFQGDGLSAMSLCSSWPSPRLPSLLAVLPATDRLPTPDSVHKHEPGLEGRARAGRGRGFRRAEGLGIPVRSLPLSTSRVERRIHGRGVMGDGWRGDVLPATLPP